MRTINAAGLELIKRNEGFRLTAYQDVAGVWTIGFGHTPASPGQTIDDAEAERLLLNDLNFAGAIVVDATAAVETSDNQFAAMLSLTFNIGIGGFRQSTVLRRHLAGDHQSAADAFLMWNKAHIDGQLVEVAGLTRRRSEERALYLLRAAPPPEPAYTHTDAAWDMQTALAKLGLYKGRIDGDWGPLSRAAYAAFVGG